MVSGKKALVVKGHRRERLIHGVGGYPKKAKSCWKSPSPVVPFRTCSEFQYFDWLSFLPIFKDKVPPNMT